MHCHGAAGFSTGQQRRLWSEARGGRIVCFVLVMALLLCFVAAQMLPGMACIGAHDILAASAYSPRNSGMDPPDSPKHIDALPDRSAGRTAEGGMGYTDAYGNTIENREPEEKPASRRAGSDARGVHEKSRYERPLPDPKSQSPAWSFK